ncbi:Fc receptor-like protein 5 isoform X2 [Toxotes jaculatrix]|uniref:Fc receptor-like protein 5 isoform X2 n=1 Tax=Toxotes jaculatrix TaxID=941984 RepID=UPI001B3AA348|nr:Fc receptor-like protein 5 isoform X2 [Toxotes jaculatrix]
MGHTSLCVLSLFLLNTLFYGKAEVSSKPTVTLQPNWSQFYRGETITVRCEIHGGDTEWEYEWRTPSSNNPPSHSEYTISRAAVSDHGEYRCRGRANNSYTEWSEPITLSVSYYKPRLTLRSDTTTIPAGGSVTLTCSVTNSADWRFEWFRRSSRSSEPQTIDGSDRTNSITEGGIYHCRGRRGSNNFFTENSDEVTIWKTVSSKPTVTLQTNWSQFYHGETITVRCEIQGGDTGWKYEWTTTNSNKPPSLSEYTISRAAVSDSGEYRCRGRRGYSYTEWSEPITLSVSSDKPRPSLTADRKVIPAGGRVTLTCSVSSSSGWKYDWYRDNKNSEPRTTQGVFQTPGIIIVSEGGLYWCRGGRGVPVYYTEYSEEVRIDTIVSDRAVVSLQPNWPEIYRGDTITVRCEIQGGDTGWKYEWETPSSYNKPSNQHEYRISSVSLSHSGDYRCRGRMKSSQYKRTEWSAPIKLTVYDNKPLPVLTVSPSWLSPGDSVTLKCEVEHPSAGWRIYWYKAVPTRSNNFYSYELLPGSINGTEQDSYIVHGPTHTAGYACRAGRGDPVYYTQYSELKFVWSGDFHPAASLTVSPDRVQHFIHDSVSLSCEGNSAEWRVRRFEGGYVPYCSSWGRMTRFTCDFYTSQQSNGVYWCESGSGEFSNAVNITVQADYHDGLILVSPVRPVTEGHSVSLGCRFRTENKLSSVFFYHNDKLIQNDTRRELNISAVSKSHEGFYKCQCSGIKSAQSWMSVKDQHRVLTVSPSWLSPGDSVTLKCEVEHPSAGWRFYWYKAVPTRSHNYSYELLPGSINGTEQDSYIVHGPTHTAGYKCRAGRGDLVHYTQYSELKFVWSGDFHPAAFLTVSPDRVQHFIYDSVSLSCEGNSTEWRVMRFNEEGSQLSCSSWGRMTGSTCNVDISQKSNGVYWCESGSGEFSNAVNITVQADHHDGLILVSPVLPVTEGHSVSFGCRFRTENKLCSVFFYHNDKLIQNDTRGELNISAVSKSHEGFYKCQCSGRKSAQSWMSVKVPVQKQSSSFPVPLIVGLVSVIILIIILLLLLYRYRKSKDSCIRSIWSESSRRGSVTNHGVNQNETQSHEYASPLTAGDTYDTIKDSEGAENDAGESQDVMYSLIELKNVRKKGRYHEPADDTVYSDLKIETTDDSPMYAQVNRQAKGRAKKKKGKSAPAETPEAVYCEVQPGTAFGL